MQIDNHMMISYKPINKLLHWLIALLVLGLLMVGVIMQYLEPSMKPGIYTMHKSIGITVLFLMILRILAILYNKRPPLPAHVSKPEYILARSVQYSLYIFLILMPLSGWIMSTASGSIPDYFYLFNFPMPGINHNPELAKVMRAIHGVIAWILVGLITLHIMGAFKHYFIDKDRVLQSML